MPLQASKSSWSSDRNALCHLRTLHGVQATHGQPSLANVQPLMLYMHARELEPLRRALLRFPRSGVSARDCRHATVPIPTQCSLILPGMGWQLRFPRMTDCNICPIFKGSTAIDALLSLIRACIRPMPGLTTLEANPTRSTIAHSMPCVKQSAKVRVHLHFCICAALPLETCCPQEQCIRDSSDKITAMRNTWLKYEADAPVAETKRPPGAGCLPLPASALPRARAPFQAPLALCCVPALPPPLQQQRHWQGASG